MSHAQIIRAWKDSAYRNSLSAEELAQLPANPAGESLTEAELDTVVGGCRSGNAHSNFTFGFSCTNNQQTVSQTINQLTSVANVQVGITFIGPVTNTNNCSNTAINAASNSGGY